MKPMLATPGDLPHGPQWTYEVKWDGMRVLAEVSAAGGLRLVSRNGNDVTGTYPELAALANLGRQALLDGEVVAFGPDGMPSFERLAGRFGARPAAAAAMARVNPVSYVLFDLLQFDGEDLAAQPFRRRRQLLVDLPLPPGPFIVPQTFDDPDALLQATLERGLEGVVAKRWDSTYRPGVRSRDWVKRSHRTTTDAVVVGWRPAPGGSVASLVVATVGEGLVYRGTAGSGLSAALGRSVAGALRPVDAPPLVAGLAEDADRLAAEGFRWAQPSVVVEIAHLGYGSLGRFRQPVVARHRPDLTPSDLGLAFPAPPPPLGGDSDGPDLEVRVGSRTVKISHLDKVLYPATGTTKARVIEYYATVAPHLLALAADRPVTRRRWPDGVAASSFFEKNLPSWAPPWIRRAVVPTSKEPVTFPVLGDSDEPVLVWLAAHSALELHTPQWRVDAQGRPLPPDRLVIDLDPGPDVGLPQCCETALVVRDLLAADGLSSRAVLSGSKGLHLYAAVDGSRSSDEVTDYVQDVGRRCGAQLPDLVVVTMAKQARVGRVFLDWSQNRAAKTTLAPWSLRGTTLPNAALPVSWTEVAEGGLRQVTLDEALERLAAGSVPLPWEQP